jgi:single-strand DNA-binding protein
MLNKVILIGNLGRDPEVRSTPSGQPVARFTLATNRKWRDKGGQRQEKTEWHNIVVWGKQAEIAGQYLTKGKQIYLEGRIETSSWDDRNTGEKKYKTEIICDNFQMLGQRGGDFESSEGRGGGYGASSSSPSSQSGPSYDEGGGGYGEPEEDDIPF